TFTISSRINTFVGFNCQDSFSFYWNKTPGINNYQVYRLGDKYLEPFFTTHDTFAVVSKILSPSLYYSVSPLIENKTGVKSYTFNYETQGVGCYIKSFLAGLIDTTSIKLDLELGTIYQVKEIIWEKFTLNGYVPLQIVSVISGMLFTYTDILPANGVNIYRVKIILNNGQIIYSEPEKVYYLNKGNYVIYPNPASQGEWINILSKVINDDAFMQVYNASGMLVFKKVLDDVIISIPPGRLSKGFYFILITNKGIREALLKLVVH
ncbi:MAG: T9SS type A sorting domain-containing protein, partial [Ginsengibacter sp.]